MYDKVLKNLSVNESPLSIGKDLHPVSVPPPPEEEPGVGVSVGHGEDAVAVLEPPGELAHVLVAVVVEGGAVALLQAEFPVADVGACLAEECADAYMRIVALVIDF